MVESFDKRAQLQSYIVLYTPERETPYVNWERIEHTGSSTTAQLRGLQPDTEYTIKVQAVNVQGRSPLSDSARALTRNGGSLIAFSSRVIQLISRAVPGQPMDVVAEPADDTRLSVHWRAPLSGAPITGYTVQVRRTDAPRDAVWTGKRGICTVDDVYYCSQHSTSALPRMRSWTS